MYPKQITKLYKGCPSNTSIKCKASMCFSKEEGNFNLGGKPLGIP